MSPPSNSIHLTLVVVTSPVSLTTFAVPAALTMAKLMSSLSANLARIGDDVRAVGEGCDRRHLQGLREIGDGELRRVAWRAGCDDDEVDAVARAFVLPDRDVAAADPRRYIRLFLVAGIEIDPERRAHYLAVGVNSIDMMSSSPLPPASFSIDDDEIAVVEHRDRRESLDANQPVLMRRRRLAEAGRGG